jgi:hypothetical protein
MDISSRPNRNWHCSLATHDSDLRLINFGVSVRVTYDWKFTDNLVLAPSPWGSRPEIFFLQLNPCDHSSYVTSSLTRGWGCLLWIGFAFMKCMYCTIARCWPKSKLCHDGKSVYLSEKHPPGAQAQIFITVREFQICWCGAPSLTRGRVCCLQLLLVLASVVMNVSESRGTHDHILLSQIETPPTWRARSPYLYPPENWWPNYNPRHSVPLAPPPTTRRAAVEVFEPASTRVTDWLFPLVLAI